MRFTSSCRKFKEEKCSWKDDKKKKEVYERMKKENLGNVIEKNIFNYQKKKEAVLACKYFKMGLNPTTYLYFKIARYNSK